MSSSWPRKSVRAEWIGRVYELSVRPGRSLGCVWTYSGSRSLDQKKRVIWCAEASEMIVFPSADATCLCSVRDSRGGEVNLR